MFVIGTRSRSRWDDHGRDSVRVTGDFHGVAAGGVGEWEQHARATRVCVLLSLRSASLLFLKRPDELLETPRPLTPEVPCAVACCLVRDQPFD